MSFVRIVCRRPPQPGGGVVQVAGLLDTRVSVVKDDGEEVDISHAVGKVEFEVGGTDCAIARVTFVDVEADLDALVEPKK